MIRFINLCMHVPPSLSIYNFRQVKLADNQTFLYFTNKPYLPYYNQTLLYFANKPYLPYCILSLGILYPNARC